jgi:hypothetical protein
MRRSDPPVKGIHPMASRSETLTKGFDPKEPPPEPISQRRKPEIGQYRLQVDRQTKASFTTLDAAKEAGMKIKTGHPIVRVAVYDVVECVNHVIESPTT